MAVNDIILLSGRYDYDYIINMLISDNLLGKFWRQNDKTDFLVLKKDHEIIIRPRVRTDKDNLIEKCRELANRYNFSVGYIMTKLQNVLDSEIENENDNDINN